MAAPIVTWTDASDDGTVISAWNMGKVNAGDFAGEKNIHIWNNKGNKDSALSDMQDVQVTTTSPDDGDTTDVVKDHWIQVRCNSVAKDGKADTTFYEIGADQTHTLTAEGCAEGVISGAVNNGLATDLTNFASITLNCKVPANAPAGPRKLNTRIIYYYT